MIPNGPAGVVSGAADDVLPQEEAVVVGEAVTVWVRQIVKVNDRVKVLTISEEVRGLERLGDVQEAWGCGAAKAPRTGKDKATMLL